MLAKAFVLVAQGMEGWNRLTLPDAHSSQRHALRVVVGLRLVASNLAPLSLTDEGPASKKSMDDCVTDTGTKINEHLLRRDDSLLAFEAPRGSSHGPEKGAAREFVVEVVGRLGTLYRSQRRDDDEMAGSGT